MSPQTETKASVGFKAGVKDYRLTYYTPEYETKDTDILAAFRVSPQPGVPPEEAGAAVAAESSTGTWTTVWTDGLTSLDRYKGRCYHIEPVPGEDSQWICYVAYPLDLFEEGSVTNMFTSIVGNVFGFKALRALRLEDLRIPPTYSKTFQGPPHGIQVERDKLNKYGRPLLGCTIKPKLGLSAKNYGRACYECLRGGLDFTKDDENVNSQPFMRWRDRFVFCAEAIYKSQAETGEIKGHYLNATAGTCEEMMKRAVFARELGVPIVMHDYLTGGFTANTTLAHYCRDNGLLLHIHRAMHAVIDRQKNHGMHPGCFPLDDEAYPPSSHWPTLTPVILGSYLVFRVCLDLVPLAQPALKQCFTPRCPVNCCASTHFGENQLALGSSGISPLTTTHPLILQHQSVRTSA
ncbi:uncharacterized protein LOC112271745 [Brachypodium distachyon]|uniref:uncharacterized protein LOC112271745 n=1 Tax=Brachypodium distachyon TaxID=15368 RepID=UPI0001D437E4|nr:uncharacterized protein LOC112271745 [Brachypodium distachyon]|eukprot:XP_024317467.1 uncharacterized protein LOC112271745 [Brachypodium distachyon]